MGSADENNLTMKQEMAIAALLTEPSVTKAAEKAGTTDRTLHRWLDEPAFSNAYRAARRETFSHAIALTIKYAPFAVQSLAKVMTDQTAPYAARVTAATALLKFSRESVELDDMVGRIAHLEQTLGVERPKLPAFGAGIRREGADVDGEVAGVASDTAGLAGGVGDPGESGGAKVAGEPVEPSDPEDDI